MIEIYFKINNKLVPFNEVGNVIDKKILQIVRELVEDRLSSISCVEHDFVPKVIVGGNNFKDDLYFDVPVCCERLNDLVRGRLWRGNIFISDNSPLRRIPLQLNHRQAYFLDGIRYSIEMAGLALFRLRKTLCDLTRNCGKSFSTHLEFVSAVLDAWSIVDSVDRLRGLLKCDPGIKHWEGLSIFDKDTSGIRDLRNSIQHINANIDKMISKKLPVMGVLSWITVLDPTSKSGFSCSLVAGALFKAIVSPVVNPSGKNIALPVDFITLTAGSCSVCLSDVMRSVEWLMINMEEHLRKQFTDLPRAGADLIACLHFGEPPS